MSDINLYPGDGMGGEVKAEEEKWEGSYIKFRCPDCCKQTTMKISKLSTTKKGNIRIDCECLECGEKWSLTRRKGVLNKITKEQS